MKHTAKLNDDIKLVNRYMRHLRRLWNKITQFVLYEKTINKIFEMSYPRRNLESRITDMHQVWDDLEIPDSPTKIITKKIDCFTTVC